MCITQSSGGVIDQLPAVIKTPAKSLTQTARRGISDNKRKENNIPKS